MKKTFQSKEIGVMVLKDDKAWGIDFQDDSSTSFGWIYPTKAELKSEKICKKPEDMSKDGRNTGQLSLGKVVKVERITILKILEE